MKDVRMSDEAFGWSGWFSVVVKVHTRTLQAVSEWKRFAEWKEFGSAKCCDRPCVFESAELERGWSGGRLNGHFLVADSGAHRLGRFVTGVNVGAHELFTPSELPSSHHASEMELTIKSCWWSEQMDCSPPGWTDDEHFSSFASQRKYLEGFRVGFDRNPGFHEWETRTAPDCGWRLQCELQRIDRQSSRGRVDSKTENAVGHDSQRARVSHTVGAELDLTVTNTWMDADPEPELFTRSSWSDPAQSLTQLDFIMSSRKLEMRRVLDSDRFKTGHRVVFAVLSLNAKMIYTVKIGANLRGWKPDDSWKKLAAETLADWGNWNVMTPLLLEMAKSH